MTTTQLYKGSLLSPRYSHAAPAPPHLPLRSHPLIQYLPNHVLYPDKCHNGASMSLQEPQAVSSTKPMSGSNTRLFLQGRGLDAASPELKRAIVGPSDPWNPKDDLFHQRKWSTAGAALKLQPSLPPKNYLNCQDYFTFKSKDRRCIVAMLIGISVTDHEDLSLNLDEEPFLSFKREIRPTKLVLQEELLRRAVLQKARVLPRPTQWDKEKILNALRATYPPTYDDEEIKFLQEQVKEVTDHFWKEKKDATTMHSPCEGKELITHGTKQTDATESGDNSSVSSAASETLDRTNPLRGWRSHKSYLRFYHALAAQKGELLRLLEGKVSNERKLWEGVAKLMNDPTWIPFSAGIEKFGPSQELPLLFNAPGVSPKEIQELFRWICSMHHQHLSNSSTIPFHVHYLKALLKEEGMEERTLDCYHKLIAVDGSSEANLRSGEVVVTCSTEAKEETDGEELLDGAGDKFIRSSHLYLRQLEFKNNLENELLALEEDQTRRNPLAQGLFQKFRDRKCASIKLVNQRLVETDRYVRRFSKRLSLDLDSDSDLEVDTASCKKRRIF